jgi:hypothetical protein
MFGGMDPIKSSKLKRLFKVLIVVSTLLHHNPFAIIIAFPILAASIAFFWFTDYPRRQKMKWTLYPLGLILVGYLVFFLICIVFFDWW